MDHPGVVGRIGRRGRAVDQVGQVAQPAQLLEARIAAEALDQHDRFGQLALADVLLHRREQALVEWLIEVRRLQRIADPLIGGVVEQDGAQQRLLGFEVGRRPGGEGIVGAQI